MAKYLALDSGRVVERPLPESGGGGVYGAQTTRSRLSSMAVTASLAPNAEQDLDLPSMPTAYRLLALATDVPARVRLYDSETKRTADVARPIGTDPTGDHGLMLEYVTTTSVLSASLSPQVDAFSRFSSSTARLRITNLDAAARAVTVTLTYFRTDLEPSLSSPPAPYTPWTRTSFQASTGPLQDKDGENVSLSNVGAAWRLYKVACDAPLRLRIYASAAQREADTNRDVATKPTGDHGVLFEFVATAEQLTHTLTPMTDLWQNVGTTGFAHITNLSGTTRSSGVTLTYLRTE
jgi:hypothetical protein